MAIPTNILKLSRAVNSRLRALGVEVRRPLKYDQDLLRSDHNHDFVTDSKFVAAYERGIQATGRDYQWRWRVHIGLWAASHCVQLNGDFVECGVNRGFLSSAIMQYLGWNQLNRRFFLLDTFCGLDPKYSNDREWAKRLNYTECYEAALANFGEFKNVQIVRGSVPETLEELPIERVAYLSLDMNCAEPEVAALSFFWRKLSSGAIVLLDDYGYRGHDTQKHAMDALTKSIGVPIVSLPTGQGMIIKP